MQKYLKFIAAALNAGWLLVAINIAMQGRFEDGKVLLTAMLAIVTPAFSLFALFAPRD